jgi:anti-sigma regulatory factor (Ser/Thr protein kinase)
MAKSLGFSPEGCAQLDLVTRELGSNLIEHASGGMIRASRLETSERLGIRLESEDHGPGIADVERAVVDGYSTRGSLGIGLGTVNRLMDNLEFHSNPDSGLHVVCERWVRSRERALFAKDMIFGVATRACRLQTVNGDTFVIKQWQGNALTSVIDGLGHGTFAQRAAFTARHYLEEHYDQPLEAIFRGVERACRATRGVVMAIARFDLMTHKLTIANVGNVEVRLFGSEKHSTPMVRRGIVGLNAPRPVSVEYPWDNSMTLVMHSDGLHTHWNVEQFPELLKEDPRIIAARLLEALGKFEDDATVVIARRAAIS